MKNCLTLKNAKMSDPIQVTLLKMQPRYSQSSCENATVNLTRPFQKQRCVKQNSSRRPRVT